MSASPSLRPSACCTYVFIFLARVLEPTTNPDQFSSCVHISFSALFFRPNRISSAKWCNEHTVTNEYNSVVEVHGLERATALNIQWRANQQRTRCEHEMRETERVANLSPQHRTKKHVLDVGVFLTGGVCRCIKKNGPDAQHSGNQPLPKAKTAQQRSLLRIRACWRKWVVQSIRRAQRRGGEVENRSWI